MTLDLLIHKIGIVLMESAREASMIIFRFQPDLTGLTAARGCGQAGSGD